MGKDTLPGSIGGPGPITAVWDTAICPAPELARSPADGAHARASVQSFAPRIAELHNAWEERRALKSLTTRHDFEAQSLLLRTIYSWAGQARATIAEVYDGSVQVTLVPESGDLLGRRLAMSFAGTHTLAVSLVERIEGHHQQWRLVAAFTTHSRTPGVPPHTSSRTPVWTRRAFEDLVLTVLDAYERDSGE